MIAPVWVAISTAQAANAERQTYTWKPTPAQTRSVALVRRMRTTHNVCAKCGVAGATLTEKKLKMRYGTPVVAEVELCERCRIALAGYRNTFFWGIVGLFGWVYVACLIPNLHMPAVLRAPLILTLLIVPGYLFWKCRGGKLRVVRFRYDGIVVQVPNHGPLTYLRTR